MRTDLKKILSRAMIAIGCVGAGSAFAASPAAAKLTGILGHPRSAPHEHRQPHPGLGH